MKLHQLTASAILLMLLTSAYAQDTREKSEEKPLEQKPSVINEAALPPKEKKTDKIAPNDKTNSKQKDSNAAESYRASEEISEDLSVSYPVDI